MIRRIPLWLTLLPLVVAIGLYHLFWQGWARDFEAMLRGWLPTSSFSVGGFPYRLEAEVIKPALAGGDIVKLFASASRVLINRGPWQPELTVIRADYPRFSAIVGPGLGASFSGKSALTSVNVVEGRLVRLSTVIEAAHARIGFAAVNIAADVLELHLREIVPVVAAPESATPPARGQLVVSGQRIRFDGGDAMTLAADMAVTGPARLTAYDRWSATGTVELIKLTLADAHGEVASIKATLVPVSRAGLRFAGTIDTICPASIAAAFAGVPAPVEKRLRAPVRLAFEGVAGAMRLTGVPNDLAMRATRAQLPACPILRGRG